MQKLPRHGSCFVCGSKNSQGIGVEWYSHKDESVTSEITLTDAQQGPPKMAHGRSLCSTFR